VGNLFDQLSLVTNSGIITVIGDADAVKRDGTSMQNSVTAAGPDHRMMLMTAEAQDIHSARWSAVLYTVNHKKDVSAEPCSSAIMLCC
jgi:hypothetical protein